MPEIIQVPEWGKVELPTALDNSRSKALLLRRSASSYGPALVTRGRHMYAQGLVGVVDAGAVQIQIVPKVYVSSSDEEDASLLLELFMLSAPSKGVEIVRAATRVHEATVLEPLIRHFAATLERQLRLEGVPRRYEAQAEESPTLRGRVDLPKLVRRGPAYSHKLPIVHYPLQSDNSLSRVLLALALNLTRRSRVAHTKATLYRCAALLDQARAETLQPALVNAVNLNRYESAWKELLDFAALLASGTSPNPVLPGEGSSTGVLLPLERLFENARRSALLKVPPTCSLRLSPDPASARLMNDLNKSRTIMTIRPDLVFRDVEGNAPVVCDAKWKRLQLSRPSLGLSPGDIYQMVTYVHRYSARHGALAYPAADPIPTTWRSSTWSVPGRYSQTLTIVEIDVARLLAAARARPDSAVIEDLARLVAFLGSATP